MNIIINGKEITTPQSWNDLPLKSQIFCYELIMGNHSIFTTSELVPFIRINLMKHLLNIDDDFIKRWEADCMQEEDGDIIFYAEMQEILQVADSLLEPILEEGEEHPKKYQIKLGLTKIPWPKLEYKGKKKKKRAYYGPANGLENLTLYELGTTFTLFEEFLKAKIEEEAEDQADILIATLYREHKPKTQANELSNYEGDVRIPYLNHETTIKRRLPRIKKLPKAVKNLILFWFASCRQSIVDNYPKVFTSDKKKSSGPDYGWGGLMMTLADGLIHLDQIAKQPYANALTYISYLEDQREQKEMEQLFASHGKK